MFPPPKKYSALSRKPTQADRSALYEDLKEYGRFTGLCWLISPEPPLVNQLPFPTMEEIIFSDEFLEATRRQQQLDCLVRRSRLQETDILRISELTELKDIAIVKIERDETWVANIPVLAQIYFDNIFPRIVEGEL